MNDEILREVDADIRRERWTRFWKQFGNKIVVVSMLVLVATAAYVYFEKIQHTKNEEITGLLLQGQMAFREGDYAQANVAFAEATEKDMNSLTMLWAGHSAAIAGDSKNAIAYFAQLKSMGKSGLSDYGAILNDIVQNKTPEGVTANKNDNILMMPFAYTRYEIAAIHALDAGNNDLAKNYLEIIQDDPQSPPTMKARAQLLQMHITSGDDADEIESGEAQANE